MLITGMALSNEQAYHAASSAQNVVNCACADIAAWLATVARELHHSLVPPVDLVLHAFKDDLRSKNYSRNYGIMVIFVLRVLFVGVSHENLK